MIADSMQLRMAVNL